MDVHLRIAANNPAANIRDDQAILRADGDSRRRFSGHGSAIAQAYNHSILPLCSPRDRKTQIEWGLRDFERRFGRTPEGMWLPETAADTDTLEDLVDAGLRFTILAPHQAVDVRPPGRKDWRDVRGGRIDPRRGYLARLPSGRTLALFFYDGPVSQAVAFEQLLSNGDKFRARLMGAFDSERKGPQLVHIATDGETYGHHHRHGDMALAYALRAIEADPDVQLTNYGEHLERFPPDHEVRIVERSSWSCVHGIERWRSHCGCSTGGRPGWNQEWRRPLRSALDWLRDRLAELYEDLAPRVLRAPWAARDAYVGVILDRSDAAIARFFAEHGRIAASTDPPDERSPEAEQITAAESASRPVGHLASIPNHRPRSGAAPVLQRSSANVGATKITVPQAMAGANASSTSGVWERLIVRPPSRRS